MPWPTPMHSAATPQRSPEACRRRARVPSTRVPDAPSGWPMAIAPPHAFTISGSTPHASVQASAWAANASFSSTAATSFHVMPARVRARFAASTGA